MINAPILTAIAQPFINRSIRKSEAGQNLAVDGLFVSPPEVAAWMKNRFGQVGPGSDEYQKLNNANSVASVVRMGSWSG